MVRVIIVGSGIAGTSLALALRQINTPKLTFSLCERAKTVGSVGSGVTLTPNAMRSLQTLGVQDEILKYSTPLSKIHSYDTGGQKLSTYDTTYVKKKYGNPLMTLEKSELQSILFNTLSSRKRDGLDQIQLGKECVRIEQDMKGVRVFFSDGTKLEGEVLVGADGFSSMARQVVTAQDFQHPNIKSVIKQTQYSSMICTMGLTKPGVDIGYEPGNVIFVFGKGKVYGNHVLKDQKQFFFSTERITDQTNLKEPLWTPESKSSIDSMKNWYFPYNFEKIAENTEKVVKISIPEVESLNLWSKGLVTLVGDAAHHIIPTSMNNVSIAIEDSTELANYLSAAVNSASFSPMTNHIILERSLINFQNKRKKRVDRIAAVSNYNTDFESADSSWKMAVRSFALKFFPQLFFQWGNDFIYKYQPGVVKM